MIASTAAIKKWSSIVDPIVVSSGVARLVATVTGPLTALMVVHFLSLTEQGYWFTFLSIIALANYAELGMGQVILQFAAYEVGGSVTGDADDKGRLKSILRITLLFGGLLSLLQCLIAMAVGYAILSTRAGSGQSAEWLGPWLLACTVAPLTLALAFLNSFLEGCQLIVSSNLRRALQAIVQVVVTFFVFNSGGKLWALGAGLGAGFAAGTVYVLLAHGRFIRGLLAGFTKNTQVSWRTEVWPLQWRYAATWVTGLFSFGLFNPVIFSLIGPEAAGQFGFTMSVTGFLLAYSQIWLASRMAVFTKLNAGAKWAELKPLYGRSVKYSIVTYLLGSLGVVAAIYVINVEFPLLAVRFLEPLSAVIILAAGGVSLSIFCISYFVRSFKEEPFIKMAWVTAGLVMILLPAGALLFQTRGASAAYFISQLAVLPMGVKIYNRYRKRIPLEHQ